MRQCKIIGEHFRRGNARPGDSYAIAAGVEHGAAIKAGTVAIDVFAEADRYALKPR